MDNIQLLSKEIINFVKKQTTNLLQKYNFSDN